MRIPLALAALAVSLTACGHGPPTSPALTTRSPIHAPAPPSASPAHASTIDAQLRDEILRQDRRMADAYNAHDLDALMAVFAPDLEFVHDTGGVLDHAQATAGFKNVFANNPDIRRDLVGPLEIYPVKDFGALQIGAHRFCHTERGKPDCGTFRFVQVWRQTAGTWQIARVISYGH